MTSCERHLGHQGSLSLPLTHTSCLSSDNRIPKYQLSEEWKQSTLLKTQERYYKDTQRYVFQMRQPGHKMPGNSNSRSPK